MKFLVFFIDIEFLVLKFSHLNLNFQEHCPDFPMLLSLHTIQINFSLFDFIAGVLQGDTFAPYLFIIFVHYTQKYKAISQYFTYKIK